MKVKTIIRRELQVIFCRDPLLAFLLLGVGAAYTVLMGLLYSPNLVNDIPLAIYDEDQTKLSRTLIQDFADAQKFRIVDYVQSPEELDALMRNKDAYCALAIPHDFSRKIKTGVGSEVLFELNGADIVFPGSLLSPAMEVFVDFSRYIGAGLMEETGQLPPQAIKNVAPIEFRLRALNNPTLNYTSFFVLGILFTAFQSGVMMAVSMSMVDEYQNFAELKAIAPAKILFAKLLPYLVMGLAGFAGAIAVAVKIFDVPYRGDLSSLFLLAGVFILAIITLASLLPAFFRDKLTCIQLIVAYAVPCFLFSGYTWPLQAMNIFSRLIAFAIPLTYIADNVRDLALGGYAPELAGSIGVLLLFGLVFFTLSAVLFARQRKRALNIS